jgi:ATP-dependent Clp protease protease subunit
MRLLLILTMLLTANLSMAKQTKEIVLTSDNTIVLNSAFTGSSVSELIEKAREMDANLGSNYPMYLFLNTPGGSIQAGLELIEFMKGLNRPVHTVTLFAASMGWQLVQHLDKRYVLRYGVLMSHKARGGFRGEFGGDGSQIDSRYGLWLRRLNLMDQQTVARTNGKKTIKQYQSEYDNELWLNGAEAVKHGYADEVVSLKCDSTLTGSNTKQIVLGFGFVINASFDKCPIRTYPSDIQAMVRTNKGYVELNKFLADGGKFGEKCIRRDRRERQGWGGETIPAVKAELCTADPELTLEDIKEKVKEVKYTLSNKSREAIKMSFSNFVSGK